ncbi:PP2C-like domain-containing protein CG9801 [Oppia nitens]|uniref:PP2C-like domain-containing protein CG9801 n=1 Tax=Oppia nitens TaxID=1686743 RepID=UPI0023DC6F6A|nr:PP2C-like domain-containing protein CG9801 [Oppia nitens]
MANIKERFSELIGRQLNQLSNCNHNSKRNPLLDTNKSINSSNGSFISRYLNGKLTKSHPDILSGKTCYDLPVKEIHKLSKKVVTASTGPGDGLTQVNRRSKPFDLADADVDFIDEDYSESNNSLPFIKNEDINGIITKSSENNDKNKIINNNEENWEQKQSINGSEEEDLEIHKSQTLALGEEIAGITKWDAGSDHAYGIATTLYECHPTTKQKAGEPIADAFGICVRENSAIMALADGVNWGEKSCLAARCAVHGAIDYLNKALYSEGSRIENTMDIFVALLRSLNAAHNLILQENGLLTTLCTAVVCQLKNCDRFIVCTCNVGDSLAYVYNEKHGVREITQGSHDIYSMRDMRDALGALGPVDGTNPELNNLTVAMTVVERGDIVFLTSDGISDNFDPVVGKFAIPKKEKPNTNKTNGPSGDNGLNGSRKSRSSLKRSNSNPDRDSAHRPAPNPNLPVVTAHQRHDLSLLRMEDLLMNGVNDGDIKCNSAKNLCQLMVDFSTKLTQAKRRILEDPDLYDNNDSSFGQHEQRQRRRRVGDKLAMVPGKLDHASIVAYKVAFYGQYKGQVFDDKLAKSEERYNLKVRATLARFESQEDFSDLSESTI